MEPAEGDGWAELQDDGSLEGEICLLNGDDISFIARRSKISSQPARLDARLRLPRRRRVCLDLTRLAHQNWLKQHGSGHRAEQRESHHPPHARNAPDNMLPNATALVMALKITARVRADCNSPVFPSRQAIM
jgi:hypothetical protein